MNGWLHTYTQYPLNRRMAGSLGEFGHGGKEKNSCPCCK